MKECTGCLSKSQAVTAPSFEGSLGRAGKNVVQKKWIPTKLEKKVNKKKSQREKKACIFYRIHFTAGNRRLLLYKEHQRVAYLENPSSEKRNVVCCLERRNPDVGFTAFQKTISRWTSQRHRSAQLFKEQHYDTALFFKFKTKKIDSNPFPRYEHLKGLRDYVCLFPTCSIAALISLSQHANGELLILSFKATLKTLY